MIRFWRGPRHPPPSGKHHSCGTTSTIEPTVRAPGIRRGCPQGPLKLLDFQQLFEQGHQPAPKREITWPGEGPSDGNGAWMRYSAPEWAGQPESSSAGPVNGASVPDQLTFRLGHDWERGLPWFKAIRACIDLHCDDGETAEAIVDGYDVELGNSSRGLITFRANAHQSAAIGFYKSGRQSECKELKFGPGVLSHYQSSWLFSSCSRTALTLGNDLVGVQPSRG